MTEDTESEVTKNDSGEGGVAQGVNTAPLTSVSEVKVETESSKYLKEARRFIYNVLASEEDKKNAELFERVELSPERKRDLFLAQDYTPTKLEVRVREENIKGWKRHELTRLGEASPKNNSILEYFDRWQNPPTDNKSREQEGQEKNSLEQGISSLTPAGVESREKGFLYPKASLVSPANESVVVDSKDLGQVVEKEIKEPKKNLVERFREIVTKHQSISFLKSIGLKKEDAESLVTTMNEVGPEVHDLRLISQFCTATKAYVEENIGKGKHLPKDDKEVQVVVMKAIDRLKMLGFGSHNLNILPFIAEESKREINIISLEQTIYPENVLDIGRASDEKWNQLINTLKEIPHVNERTISIQGLKPILENGLSEKQQKYLERLKDNVVLEKNSGEMEFLVATLFREDEVIDYHTNKQNFRIIRAFKDWGMEEPTYLGEYDADLHPNIAFQIASLKYCPLLFDIRYRVPDYVISALSSSDYMTTDVRRGFSSFEGSYRGFVLSEDIKERFKLIGDLVKYGGRKSKQEYQNEWEKKLSAYRFATDFSDGRDIVPWLNLYMGLGLNDSAIQERILDNPRVAMTYIERILIEDTRIYSDLLIKDRESLQTFLSQSQENRDLVKISHLLFPFVTIIDRLDLKREDVLEMYRVENGEFILTEKFFEYIFSRGGASGVRNYYIGREEYWKILNSENISKLLNPEAKHFWGLAEKYLGNKIMSGFLLTEIQGDAFDYQKFIEKYGSVVEDELFLNKTFYEEYIWRIIQDARSGSSLTHSNLVRQEDFDKFPDGKEKLFYSLFCNPDEISSDSIRMLFPESLEDRNSENKSLNVFVEKYIHSVPKGDEVIYFFSKEFVELYITHDDEFFEKIPDLITDYLIEEISDPNTKEFFSFVKDTSLSLRTFLFQELRGKLNSEEYGNLLSEYTQLIEVDSEIVRTPNLNLIKTLSQQIPLTFNSHISEILTERTLRGFPEADRYFWNSYITIQDKTMKSSFLSFYLSKSEITKEQIDSTLTISQKVMNSLSREIIRLKDNIINSICSPNKTLEKAKEEYEIIENIFVRNNSPVPILRSRVFNTLYLDRLLQSSPGSAISQEFKGILNNSEYSQEEKEEIISSQIRKDLLNISKDSTDENLFNFLTRLKDGMGALSFYDSFLQEGFTDTEIINQMGEEDSEYLEKSLDIFFTASGKISTKEKVSERIQELRTLLGMREGQSFSSGIYKTYIEQLTDFPTGDLYEDIEKILLEMTIKKGEAHLRGLKYAEQGVKIENGDLIKWVKSLNGIIDNGVYAKDFLGAEAGQDATPYDTDAFMIQQINESTAFSQVVRDNIAYGFGGIALIIRDRGQFRNSNNGDVNNNKNSKYELIHSGYMGVEKHYGIRTGIATTEIDYICLTDSTLLNEIKFQIASKGIYIPVVNLDGKIIFTPDEFEKQRETFAGVPGLANKPYHVDIETNNIGNVIDKIAKNLDKDREKTTQISTHIQSAIEKQLKGRNLLFENTITGLEGLRIEHIGSTSRSTHLIGSSDFDFSILLDRNQLKNLDSNQKGQLINDVINSIGVLQNPGTTNQMGTDTLQMAGAKIKLGSGEIVEFDLAIVDKGNNINGSNSHEFVLDRLNHIREKEGEEKYKFVIANILVAKKVLKEFKCYKKGAKEGGLGGIGIENWILQHSGNFENATEEFLKAAQDKDGKIVSFETFKSRYTIYDPGKDIRTGSHDNFVRDNMTASGYEKMIDALQALRNKEIKLDKLF